MNVYFKNFEKKLYLDQPNHKWERSVIVNGTNTTKSEQNCAVM